MNKFASNSVQTHRTTLCPMKLQPCAPDAHHCENICATLRVWMSFNPVHQERATLCTPQVKAHNHEKPPSVQPCTLDMHTPVC